MFSLELFLNQFVYHSGAPLLFSSGLFVWIFAIFITVFYFISHTDRPKLLFVTLFSYFFYYKSSGYYFLILIASTVIDYNLSWWMYHARKSIHRKLILILSLVLNLGMLGYFKYTNFIMGMWSEMVGSHFSPLSIILPVGVSFFTFQSLSYTIDIYRREIKPVDRILDYAFFVSFFPQLVAGPIVRARDFIPQIRKPTLVTQMMFAEGLYLVATGLFKKCVISDYLSTNFVDRIFENPALYTGFENLMAIYAYALQIYCDFSGYSDMAIGIALIFGYKLCLNFDSPYQSLSLTDFWRRWHISLSSWLRDYLYIPLGGNRKGKIRTYINLFLTMVLGGLWHGASLQFLIWGALHGSGLALHKFWSEKGPKWNHPLWKMLSWGITFHFVCLGWVYFRSESFESAHLMLAQIWTSWNGIVALQWIEGYYGVFALLILGYLLHFIPSELEDIAKEEWANRGLVFKILAFILVVLVIVQFKSSGIQPFIYFQF